MFRLNLFGKLGVNGSNVVQPTRMMRITRQIYNSCLNSRDANGTARSIELLNRHLFELFARYENNTGAPTFYVPAVFFEHNLQLLWPLVRRSVILGSREEPDV